MLSCVLIIETLVVGWCGLVIPPVRTNNNNKHWLLSQYGVKSNNTKLMPLILQLLQVLHQ